MSVVEIIALVIGCVVLGVIGTLFAIWLYVLTHWNFH
jgi:hypothetical protein